MARARSPDSIEAEKLYHEGMKLVDIAKRIGVPDGTVRRWKSTQKWDGEKCEQGKKKENERSDKKKANVRKSKGAPKGNKNAVGHAPSVPKRNKNAEKHGAYNKFYWDDLDDDEIELMNDIPTGEEFTLQQQIIEYTLRARRLKHRIKKLENDSKQGLYVKGVKKKKHAVYDEDGKAVNEYEDTVTDTENVIKGIIALESELTKVQRAKNNSIDSLIKLRAINERYDDLLNGWKAKAAAEAKTGDDEEIDEIQIYIPHNGRDEI